MMPTFIMMSMKMRIFADKRAQILAVLLKAHGQRLAGFNDDVFQALDRA